MSEPQEKKRKVAYDQRMEDLSSPLNETPEDWKRFLLQHQFDHLSRVFFALIYAGFFTDALHMFNKYEKDKFSVNEKYDTEHGSFTAFGVLLYKFQQIKSSYEILRDNGKKLFCKMLSEKMVDLKKSCMDSNDFMCDDADDNKWLPLPRYCSRFSLLPLTATVAVHIKQVKSYEIDLLKLFTENAESVDFDEQEEGRSFVTPLVAACASRKLELFEKLVLNNGISAGLNICLCFLLNTEQLPANVLKNSSFNFESYVQFIKDIFQAHIIERELKNKTVKEPIDFRSKALYASIYNVTRNLYDVIKIMKKFSREYSEGEKEDWVRFVDDKYKVNGFSKESNDYYYQEEGIEEHEYRYCGCEKSCYSLQCHKFDGTRVTELLVPGNSPCWLNLFNDCKFYKFVLEEQLFPVDVTHEIAIPSKAIIICLINNEIDVAVKMMKIIDSHPNAYSHWIKAHNVPYILETLFLDYFHKNVDITKYLKFVFGRKALSFEYAGSAANHAQDQYTKNVGISRNSKVPNNLWAFLWYGWPGCDVEVLTSCDFSKGLHLFDHTKTELYHLYTKYKKVLYRMRAYAFLRAFNYMQLLLGGMIRNAQCIELCALYLIDETFSLTLREEEVVLVKKWATQLRTNYANLPDTERQKQFKILLFAIKETQ